MTPDDTTAARLRSAVTAKINFEQQYELLLEALGVEDDAVLELDEVMGMVEELADAETAEGISLADVRELKRRIEAARKWRR